MPPINNFASRNEWEIACWEKILKSKNLLQLLIPVHARHALVIRAVTIDILNSVKSYKQIEEELWLSPQTISGIKKSLREKTYKSYLERSKKERKKKIYSSSINTKSGFSRPIGIPRRTKYGTVYM